MITRREFIGYFTGIGFTAVSTSAFSMRRLFGKLSQGSTRQLTAADQVIMVQAGERILLPNNPGLDQTIQFVYGEKSFFCPQISSESHEVCYANQPLILDVESTFSLVFDGERQDWYALGFNV